MKNQKLNSFQPQKNLSNDSTNSGISLFCSILEMIFDYMKTHEREKTKRELLTKIKDHREIKIEL